MKGIPLIETQDPALIVRGFNLGLKLVSNMPQVLTIEQLEHYEQNLPQLQEVLRRGFVLPGEVSRVEVVESAKVPTPEPLILTATGETFAEWLEAREKLHKFLTGETVIFRDMFMMDDRVLARTDIMPVFRPAGATNRMALDWKMKLGMNASYEEADVMKYKNSRGLDISQLGFIKRSIRPDADTLGKNAKSPDGLLEVKVEKNQNWINLFGWSDADNLHFLITDEHLDSGETLTWFPDDRLPGGERVAHGYWVVDSAQADFRWHSRGLCSPSLGARLVEFFALRKS